MIRTLPKTCLSVRTASVKPARVFGVRENANIPPFLNCFNLNKIIMKEFFNVMFEDMKQDGFTKKEIVIYGVVVPLAFIATLGIVGWIEQMLAML